MVVVQCRKSNLQNQPIYAFAGTQRVQAWKPVGQCCRDHCLRYADHPLDCAARTATVEVCLTILCTVCNDGWCSFSAVLVNAACDEGSSALLRGRERDRLCGNSCRLPAPRKEKPQMLVLDADDQSKNDIVNTEIPLTCSH
jgi:hypothetical protein